MVETLETKERYACCPKLSNCCCSSAVKPREVVNSSAYRPMDRVSSLKPGCSSCHATKVTNKVVDKIIPIFSINFSALNLAVTTP